MKHLPLSRALKQVWVELSNLNIKRMPELVFDEFADYMAVLETLPAEALAADKSAMLCGFRFRWHVTSAETANEADRFVAQEIGA